ncbi:DDE-type integrase/transposase/recombinase [Paraburkholderia strydomiana]|uniref:DDE-type integrase/transposase/recombinase n=1 Tax=Paraburkholderia strydomiana TaxID=1245417 RepID=UPI0038B9ABC4
MSRLTRVDCQFQAERPNQFWVSDFTFVSVWHCWMHMAFAITVFSQCFIGRRVSSSMTADFVLDAFEQPLCAHRLRDDETLVHHSDAVSQRQNSR